MVDYCLFVVFFQNDILSYNVIGEHFEFMPKTKSLIDFKCVTRQDEAEVIVINKESIQFIDYYWKNLLSDKVKWLFVIPKNEEDAKNIFNEIRGFGEPYFVHYPKPLIIIKNVTTNFKDNYRRDILMPMNMIGSLDNFLEIQVMENNTDDVAYIIGDKEYQLIKSLSKSKKMQYFGHPICSQDLNKCKMFSKMKFHIIECVNIDTGITQGYFVHSDYVEKVWLYHLTGFNSLDNFYKFSDYKISIPVY